MSRQSKRSHCVMLSSDSDQSENENPRARNTEGAHVESADNDRLNLNNTSASDLLDDLNGLIQEVDESRQQSSSSSSSSSLSPSPSPSSSSDSSVRVLNDETESASTTPMRSVPGETVSTQKTIEQYFPRENSNFDEIDTLNEDSLRFRIRGKTIFRSSIRHYGTSGRVFDAIVCDRNGEIKVVVFNDDIDRTHPLMELNRKVVIENGQIKKTDERYRTHYSIYEIRVAATTRIEPYESNGFNPLFKIMKKTIRDAQQLAHNAYVDVEGKIILDRGTSTTTSEITRAEIRRRCLKIEDESGSINIVVWNQKINEIQDQVINKTIRVRKGKVNYFNDSVSINISDSSIIEVV
ncbi:unnamed protein product [Adineta ricciae]|uniref:Uncharacterized protein n=1 Tax=Adineta ricciae TaxID=249248 RepID=A0A815LWZ6_ADIRI|nr:unnamed protein product [Adineta ricciae]CAF1411533.1 unnamed protein product [Adineta ricciae]